MGILGVEGHSRKGQGAMAEVGRGKLTQRRAYRKPYENLQFYNTVKKYTWKDNGIHVMKRKRQNWE